MNNDTHFIDQCIVCLKSLIFLSLLPS